MVNKRGWLRIAEAGLGILIIMGVLLTISGAKQKTPETDYSQKIYIILDEVSKDNPLLRNEIISQDVSAEVKIEDFAREKIGIENMAYRARICGINEECLLDKGAGKKDVWAAEKLVGISADINSDYTELKRVKLYAWRE